ncbi:MULTISPECIES: cobalamin-binding protein [unclassified Bordetella]|uniref:cobalamin-binding protein n=1 Tax=unclassified Bordetella TaxID=2630031 RepID=UPI00132C8D30|nr:MULTISPECIES: cobalamin-binding protein [unclassified Bordetella]MVW72420.1 ABC transporter substrate-binding protein [Bordetella sp. 15P40C-2]MVW79194.1 ABC transporter substrate-binding protein [Bordetella sp. 02P26C-1]
MSGLRHAAPRRHARWFALTCALFAGGALSAPIVAPSGAVPATADATIAVRDDQGREVVLARPARRALTAAPHATELVYAAGAGDFLVGTAQGSNYPDAARSLPGIGTTLGPNLEIAMTLRPDLLIAWQPLTPDRLGDLMLRLNVPVYYSDPRTLAAIPDAVETLGRLFGTESRASAAAQGMRARLATLTTRYAQRKPVRVFIEAGAQPLYTVNRESIINDAIRICGGVNVFADADLLAPQISLESVLAARPDAVITSAIHPEEAHENLRAWQARGLPAAQRGHVYTLDADALYRPGPRLIDVTEQLCAHLDKIRHSVE